MGEKEGPKVFGTEEERETEHEKVGVRKNHLPDETDGWR